MTLADIRSKPTQLYASFLKSEACDGVHESCFRSFHILEAVKRLLKENCPPAVLLEIIDDLEAGR